MLTRKPTSLRLRACRRCGGDAYLETLDRVAEWRCLQCSRLVSDSAERPAYGYAQRQAA